MLSYIATIVAACGEECVRILNGLFCTVICCQSAKC